MSMSNFFFADLEEDPIFGWVKDDRIREKQKNFVARKFSFLHFYLFWFVWNFLLATQWTRCVKCRTTWWVTCWQIPSECSEWVEWEWAGLSREWTTTQWWCMGDHSFQEWTWIVYCRDQRVAFHIAAAASFLWCLQALTAGHKFTTRLAQ